MQIKRSAHLADYTSAHELFSAARDACKEMRAIEYELARLKEREGLHAQSYEMSVRSSEHSDFTRQVDSRLVLTQRKREVYEQDKALYKLALSVLYGEGTSHGLSELVHLQACECTEQHYLLDRSWQAIARNFAIPVITARRNVRYALDMIDYLGLEHAIAGVGQATLDDFLKRNEQV